MRTTLLVGKRWCRVAILVGTIGLFVGTSSAATITVSNVSVAAPAPIILAAGFFEFATGTVRIGTFPFGSDFGRRGVLSTFQQFGESVSIGLNGNDGFYQNTVTDTVVGSSFSGSGVYTVISGSSGPLELAHCPLIIEHDFYFVDEPGFTPDAVVRSDSRVVFGGVGTRSIFLNGGHVEGLALNNTLGICPEPSSALLSMLGLMVCLVRRRSDSKIL